MNVGFMERWARWSCLAPVVAADRTPATGPSAGTDFVFQSSDWPSTERFVVRIEDAHVREMARAELALPLAERRQFALRHQRGDFAERQGTEFGGRLVGHRRCDARTP